MFLLDTNVVSGLRKVRAGKADPRPYRDGLIAATALAHGMTLVTRDVTDLAPTGVALLDPWEPMA